MTKTCQDEKIHLSIHQIVAIFNSGYHKGHNDTVEACYVDVKPCDMQDYHDDIINDILTEFNNG